MTTHPEDAMSAAGSLAIEQAAYSQQTLQELGELASRYPQAQSALLPMLHLLQSVDGCVTPRGIETCARLLDISAAEVSAVATFYTMYKRRPVGDYHVGVCTNTLCAVMGGDAIFERLKGHLDVGNDETTQPSADREKSITLEHVECNAACDYAPVMMVNWEFFDNQTPQSAVEVVDDLRKGKTVTATRGARVCTWREAERVLAGFTDDRADEGPGAGPATLAGLKLARQRNWKAPEPDGGSGTTATSSQDAVAANEAAPTRRAESETEIASSEADTQHDRPRDRDGDAPSEHRGRAGEDSR